MVPLQRSWDWTGLSGAEMIPVSLFMIPGGFWCFENGDCVQMFLEEMAVRHKKFSLFETGECGDWCIGICR